MEEEAAKYSVSLKKGFKIFYIICIVLCLIAAFCICLFGLPMCETAGNYIDNVFCSLFFLFLAILAYYKIVKKVTVYKGKIVYRTVFKKIEYKPSKIYRSKTEYVETSYRNELGGWESTSDKITVFYDNKGKKLFSFGLSYDNVQMLQKTVDNNRKSIINSKRI